MRRRYTAISSRLMGHRRQFDHLNRRDFISLLGSTAAAWPLTSHAQQPDQMRLIGVLMPYAQSDGDAQSWLAAFRGALSKLGWTEGSNLRIELRWSADNPDRMRALANELVDLRPNTIFGVTTPVVGALARETKTIPIVFAGVSDPIASGFAANLAQKRCPGWIRGQPGHRTGHRLSPTWQCYETAVEGPLIQITGINKHSPARLASPPPEGLLKAVAAAD